MKYKNLIFDFDGTLFDTNDLYTRDYLQLSQQYGFSDEYDEVYMWLAKYSVYYAISQHDWGCRYRVIGDLYRPMRNKALMEEACPFPDCSTVLMDLKEKGYRCFVLTDNNNTVLEVFKKHGIDIFFDGYVFSSGEGIALKPSSEGMDVLIRRYSLNSHECLMIGDRDADVICASGAYVDAALIDTHHYFDNIDAKYKINSLSDLLAFL